MKQHAWLHRPLHFENDTQKQPKHRIGISAIGFALPNE